MQALDPRREIPFLTSSLCDRPRQEQVSNRGPGSRAIQYMYTYQYYSIGNAKEAGMAATLHLSSSDYSLAVSIFFIGYLLLEVPSNMILSRTRPSLYLPGLMVSNRICRVTFY